ncbi:hypothetical protein GCM10019059_37880 [Camelimonas fluminis]|uniref:Uncharacterized protein n=1 Tax=Camelimonas fluminis TaxID=1576911 RepID=A0ABV7UPH2_9HYPH|nr:hypothetical protein [Camelimonas fluminis]GHE74760.1 hypothetical protein GCM10019059_37880 [Camelimonas fluminis]
MKWKPISKLTDKILDEHFGGRLMFSNPCNGPDLPFLEARPFNADEVRQEKVWTHFIILPKSPSEWPAGYIDEGAT